MAFGVALRFRPREFRRELDLTTPEGIGRVAQGSLEAANLLISLRDFAIARLEEFPSLVDRSIAGLVLRLHLLGDPFLRFPGLPLRLLREMLARLDFLQSSLRLENPLRRQAGRFPGFRLVFFEPFLLPSQERLVVREVLRALVELRRLRFELRPLLAQLPGSSGAGAEFLNFILKASRPLLFLFRRGAGFRQLCGESRHSLSLFLDRGLGLCPYALEIVNRLCHVLARRPELLL